MNEDKKEIAGYIQHHRIKGSIVLVLLLLATFLAVKTVGEIKAYRFIGGGVPISNTITVSGEGEVFAVPDVASFSFSVIEEKPTVEEAQREATQKINVVLELVRQAGVEDRDIKTTAYNVYPRYEFKREICIFGIPCPPGRQELTGYEVNQTISIKVRDTDKAGKILTDVGVAGVSNISGLNFTIDDEEALKQEARKAAIDNAKEKAEQLAQDLGVRLVRIVSFGESGSQPRFLRTFDTAVAEFGGAPGAVPEIPVGENKIISNISITYEIR